MEEVDIEALRLAGVGESLAFLYANDFLQVRPKMAEAQVKVPFRKVHSIRATVISGNSVTCVKVESFKVRIRE